MSSTAQVKVFGIRHHGPGSAKSLLKVLEEWQPDCLLVEGAPDSQPLLHHIAHEGLKPPVALLVYNPKNLQQASYFPFAEFSPEWQAIKWAIKKNIPSSFMDLPMSFRFAMDEKQELLQMGISEESLDENTEGGEPAENPIFKIEKDPLYYLATLAGYQDSERWWEIMFEQNDNSANVFETILEMMTTLRETLNKTETQETLLREAYMRKMIRQSMKEGYSKIAVVCGAWHAPVLANLDNFKEKTDTDALKGLKKISTESTWVPWSYDRLSIESGYGAGVVSPAWYDMLFSKRSNATIRWMTKAARLLRKEDLSASSAHSIEAVRLAETLATLRGRSIAGLEELEEAALSIFCDGYDSPMQLIREKLVIGDVIGKVPPEIPQVPLQRDFEACIKTARLSKEYATTEAITKELDLRTKTNLFASHLLHRLVLLNIHWGKTMKGSRYKLGTFKETWKLQWKPDFTIRIIEAAQWGNTVEEASTGFIQKKAATITELPALVELIDQALKADIKPAIPSLIKRLQTLSALTDDVLLLMDSLSPLVNIVKYGNVRGTNAQAVSHVLDEIIPRICIGLPIACINIDDDSAILIHQKLQTSNQAINLLNFSQHTEGWLKTLKHITDIKNVQGILVGSCIRILFDKNRISLQKAAISMRYALSQGSDVRYAANWLEGFLQGSGLLLIHHESLWYILDEWVEEIGMDRLQELLPILRRTFSEFSPIERQKLLQLAQKEKIHSTLIPPQYLYDLFDEIRAEPVFSIIQMFL